ncbi:MAG: Clp protease N-terminal domain-containing protein [Armatimonadota bacterium]
MVWELWTEPALQSVAHARTEARRLGDTQVCTEHLLVGLLKEDDPLVGRVLDHFDIPLPRLRQDLQKNLQPRPENAAEKVEAGETALPDLPLGLRSHHVTDLAEHEARLSGAAGVYPAHVLLALIRDGDGLAGRIPWCTPERRGANARCTWILCRDHRDGVNQLNGQDEAIDSMAAHRDCRPACRACGAGLCELAGASKFE